MRSSVASARLMFEIAELNFPSIKSASLYKDALDILRDVIGDESIDAQTRELASNLRMSHTRNLIDRLDQLEVPNPKIFGHYAAVLGTSARPEARTLVQDLDSEYRRKLLFAMTRYGQR